MWVWSEVAYLKIGEGKIFEKILVELGSVFQCQNRHNSENWATSGEVSLWDTS